MKKILFLTALLFVAMSANMTRGSTIEAKFQVKDVAVLVQTSDNTMVTVARIEGTGWTAIPPLHATVAEENGNEEVMERLTLGISISPPATFSEDQMLARTQKRKAQDSGKIYIEAVKNHFTNQLSPDYGQQLSNEYRNLTSTGWNSSSITMGPITVWKNLNIASMTSVNSICEGAIEKSEVTKLQPSWQSILKKPMTSSFVMTASTGGLQAKSMQNSSNPGANQ